MHLSKFYLNMVNRRQDYLPYLFYKDVSDFPGLFVEKYFFNSFSGDKIFGFCYYYKNSKKIIVFTHGMGAGHKAYLNEIELFCKKGYKVYTFDIKGCGESEGNSIGSLYESLADLDAFLKYYKTINKEKVIVVGHSWGAFASLNILPLHEEIIEKSIIISGFINLKQLIKSYTKFLYPIFYPAIFSYENHLFPQYSKIDIIKYLNNSKIPLLFIHSKNDNMVLFSYSIKFLQKKVKRTNLSFIILNNRKHNPYLTDRAFEYYDKIFTCYRKNKKKFTSLDSKKNYFSKVDFHLMMEDDLKLFDNIFSFLDKN